MDDLCTAMRPRFLPGHLVQLDRLQTGVVVAVKSANDVPDACVRGMADQQRWSYWVFQAGRVLGPLSAAQVHGV